MDRVPVHDTLGRLDSVTGSGGLPHGLSLGYTDANALDSKNGLSYSYTSLPHAPSSVSGRAFAYDANGNQTGLGSGGVITTGYAYDGSNLLTRVVITATDESTHTTHYVYDGDGALVLQASGDCTYTYHVGDYYELDSVWIGEDTWVEGSFCTHQQRAYLHVGGTGVALAVTYPYTRVQDTTEYTSTVTYLHRDRAGNLTEVTDEGGALVGRARYDAFGQILSSTIPSSVTTRLYAGAIHDSDTGLYKIGARWYDPIAGVWLTPDAIVPDVNNPIAWNPYAFNYQNPVNYSDPSGHFPICFSFR